MEDEIRQRLDRIEGFAWATMVGVREISPAVREKVDAALRVAERISSALTDSRNGTGTTCETTAGGFDGEVSYVYAIQRGEGGPVKIGRTKNPQARLKALQTSSPEPLTLLGALPVCVHNAGDQEMAFQKNLTEHKLEGEWFAPHPDVMAVVDYWMKR